LRVTSEALFGQQPLDHLDKGGSMRSGYLVFTTESGDELHATLLEDSEFFDTYKKAPIMGNDDALELWNTYLEEHDKLPNALTFDCQTLVNTPWPFNDIKIIATLYIQVY
jgi:hypothetical protein